MTRWKAQSTLLIVGEGYDEVAFLSHIKQFPGVRGLGVQIMIKNARGKGALGVIDCTVKLIANVDYDKVAVLLDTDTDWTPKAMKLAKSKGIQVLTSEPCLEAVLLRALGKKPGDLKELKKQLQPYVSGDATRRENYVEHFGLPVLEAARADEPTIDELLKLFGI